MLGQPEVICFIRHAARWWRFLHSEPLGSTLTQELQKPEKHHLGRAFSRSAPTASPAELTPNAAKLQTHFSLPRFSSTALQQPTQHFPSTLCNRRSASAPAAARDALRTDDFTRSNVRFTPKPNEDARNAEICKPQTANASTDSLENA